VPIAKVSAYGMVSTFSAGNSTISVSTSDGGYSDQCLITVLDTLSIVAQTEFHDIVIYPNPVQDMLYLKFPDAQARKEVRIFSMQGQCMATAATNNDHLEINMENTDTHTMLLIAISFDEKTLYFKIINE